MSTYNSNLENNDPFSRLTNEEKVQVTSDYRKVMEAINDAIDKEAKEHDGKFVTDERETITTQKTYDFEGLINEFNEITMAMMDEDPAYYQPRIIDLVTRILGPGKKVNEATIQQVELIAEIVESLKDMKK